MSTAFSDSRHASFQEHFQQVAAETEERRVKYRSLFARNLLLSLTAILLMPWYARPELINTLLESLGLGFAISWSHVCILIFWIVVLSIWVALWPVFAYRGRNKGAGLMPLRYSLKDHIYSKLLGFFPGFQFAPDGGHFTADTRKATIIPEYQVYFAEDCLQGVLNDCTVKLAETKVIQVKDGERIAVFNGLFIVVDICEVRVKLTGNFAGRTVLIADEQKELESIREKYVALERFILPGDDYEHKFEAYTDNKNEASQLLQPSFLDSLLGLEKQLQGLSQQVEHWDNRLAHAWTAFIDWLPLWPGSKLPAEVEYRRQYGQRLDLTKADMIASDVMAINHHVQAEFYDDKLLITLPCKHDLFEPNSLFEPALNPEDGEVLFMLMESLDIITRDIRAYLSSRSA